MTPTVTIASKADEENCQAQFAEALKAGGPVAAMHPRHRLVNFGHVHESRVMVNREDEDDRDGDFHVSLELSDYANVNSDPTPYAAAYLHFTQESWAAFRTYVDAIAVKIRSQATA